MQLAEVKARASENRALVCDALVQELEAVVSSQNCTKRTAVRLAISNAIQNGALQLGDYLPSEKVLAEILNVSLGTVQVALGHLKDVGLVQRRRGDGTRVSDAEPLRDNIWHFRFLSRETNAPLRITESKLKMSTVARHGYWSDFLGPDDYYTRLTRNVRMYDGTKAAAQMYIPGKISKGLGDIDVSELELINIRPFLETQLNLRINGRTSSVSVVTPTEAEIRKLNLTTRQPHFEISATAFTDKKKPAYFQRIWVAVSDCNLEF